MVNKAIFLDRDGVLNIPLIKNRKSYAPTKFKDFRFYPYVKLYCNILKKKNFKLIVVTNQPDLSKGKIKQEEYNRMCLKLKLDLKIDEIYTSKSSSSKSPYRKPKPYMLLKSIKKNKFNQKKCFMIGDRWSDIEAASKANCKSIFINRNYHEPFPSDQLATVDNFKQAVEIILKKFNK